MESLGPATDVYGLGAILFALLTGEPPVEGETTDEVLDRWPGRDPVAAIAQPEHPAALEAVCLKAWRQPADRYPTATALAEDVEHWLADEPVSAWREPFSRRARRWLKRHRTIVMAGVTSALAAILLLSGFVIRLNTEKEKLEIANHALFESQQKEEAARQEAEVNLQLASAQLYGTDSTH